MVAFTTKLIFNLQENHDRNYTKSGITLRAPAVDTLSMWNTTDPWKNEDNDFLFVQFLLVEIFGGGRNLAKKLANIELKMMSDDWHLFEVL